MIEQLNIREAVKEDCKDIFDWRNDEQTRAASFNSEMVSYATHAKWFEAALQNPARLIYIGIDQNGIKIGVIRLDILNDEVAEISINLSPQMRGRGLGSLLISIACDQLVPKLNKSLIVARTRDGNLASIKSFVKSGFLKIIDYIDDKGSKIVVLIKGTKHE